MSTYRCDAGHRTERLTECTGYRSRILGNHVTVDHDRAERCACSVPPAPLIDCPVTIGTSAPDALTIPPMCGRPATLICCVACSRPAAQDYCDDCWSDLQGGCSEG